jgi:hypothetical protein
MLLNRFFALKSVIFSYFVLALTKKQLLIEKSKLVKNVIKISIKVDIYDV